MKCVITKQKKIELSISDYAHLLAWLQEEKKIKDKKCTAQFPGIRVNFRAPEAFD